jgi:hypothetical protein
VDYARGQMIYSSFLLDALSEAFFGQIRVKRGPRGARLAKDKSSE